MFFAAEYANRNKDAVSCIDIAVLWPMPSLSISVPIVPIAEMDFGTVVVQPKIHIPTIFKDGVIHFLKRGESLNRIASVMMTVERTICKKTTGTFICSHEVFKSPIINNRK